MRRRLILVVAAFVTVTLPIVPAAQVPCIQVLYNDRFYPDVRFTDCLRDVIELYVGVFPTNTYYSALEFAISYPPSVTWIGDTHTAPVVVGDSPNGVAMSWSQPISGFAPTIVMQATVLLACDPLAPMQTIDIVPHPVSGARRLVEWPTYETIDLSTTPAFINGHWGPPYHPPIPIGCEPTVPVQETTWGKVKSLYAE